MPTIRRTGSTPRQRQEPNGKMQMWRVELAGDNPEGKYWYFDALTPEGAVNAAARAMRKSAINFKCVR